MISISRKYNYRWSSTSTLNSMNDAITKPRKRRNTHNCLESAKSTLFGSTMDNFLLLPSPAPLTIASFVEEATVHRTPISEVGMEPRRRVLQCFLGCLAEDKKQKVKYALGTPTDIPVMLGYFDNTSFHQVLRNDTIYESLFEYVANQLSMDDDMYLLDTPVTMTLYGEFDDAEQHELVTRENVPTSATTIDDSNEDLTWESLIKEVDEEIAKDPTFYNDDDEDKNDDASDDYHHDMDDEEFDETSTIAESDDNYDDESDAYENDIDEEDNNMDEEENKETRDSNTTVDEELLRKYHIPPEAIFTDEDGESFSRAHKRADRIFSYVEDLKLIGSFHYAKKNYHLVRILEVRALCVSLDQKVCVDSCELIRSLACYGSRKAYEQY